MKRTYLTLFVLLMMTTLPACAQRSTSSDYNLRKAIEAYYDDEDLNKALDLVNEVLDDTPDNLDARFLRSKILWNIDKYANALRDVSYAIKNYKGKPGVYRATLLIMHKHFITPATLPERRKYIYKC